MKRYVVLLALLVLTTSAWGDAGCTCDTSPCGNMISCWNSSPCFNQNLCGNVCGGSCSSQFSSVSCMSNSLCVQNDCGSILGFHSCIGALGCFQSTSCLGAFGGFQTCGGSMIWNCGFPCGNPFDCCNNWPSIH